MEADLSSASFLYHFYQIFIILFFLNFSTIFGAVSYPYWFLYQKDYPEITIGYSNKGLSALLDAEQRYVIYSGCIASGELYRFQDWDVQHSNYFYEYSSDSLKNISGQLQKLAQFTSTLITKDYISAFSKEVPDELNHQMLNISEIEKPNWVDRYPCYIDSNFHYGIGTYTFRANENDAWRTAEEKAIFNIMSYNKVEVHSINIVEKNNEQSYSEKLNMLKINYLIKDIEILERWRDPAGKSVYVLVRIKKSDLIKRGN